MAIDYPTMLHDETPIRSLIRHCNRLAQYSQNNGLYFSRVPTALIESIARCAELVQEGEFDDGR